MQNDCVQIKFFTKQDCVSFLILDLNRRPDTHFSIIPIKVNCETVLPGLHFGRQGVTRRGVSLKRFRGPVVGKIPGSCHAIFFVPPLRSQTLHIFWGGEHISGEHWQ